MKIPKRIQKMGMADLIGYSLNLKRKIEKSVNHYGNLPLTHPKRIYIEKVIRNYTLTLLELNKFPTHIIEKYKQELQSRVAIRYGRSFAKDIWKISTRVKSEKTEA